MSNDNCLCSIVARVLEGEIGGTCEANVVYERGEMDVLHTDKLGIKSYYELKCSNKQKFIGKGIAQVSRAVGYGVADKGYVVTPDRYIKVGSEKDGS